MDYEKNKNDWSKLQWTFDETVRLLNALSNNASRLTDNQPLERGRVH